MQLGLKYYHDFLQRIPREECTQIYQFIKRVVASDVDPLAEVFIMGSYRIFSSSFNNLKSYYEIGRGAPSCGDIDIIITHPEDIEGIFFSNFQYKRYLQLPSKIF
jgi:hypothetical protein